MPRPRRRIPGFVLLLAIVAAMAAAVGAIVYAYHVAATLQRPGDADAGPGAAPADRPYTLVLGVAQDAGIPQAGAYGHPAWTDPSLRRHAVCLAIIDPRSDRRWIIDATPDLREQLHRLHTESPGPLDGVFLTHAHMGHYTGLMFLGHESMGARGVPVHATPRMGAFLRANGPWSQLVEYENIVPRELAPGEPVRLADDLAVTPIPVPHRQEYADVVAFRVDGPERSVLWLPDIDSWREWDEWGVSLESAVESVDVAYLDGTFFADGEIPGRDMSTFPHPFIATTIDRLAPRPGDVRARVRFIHLNHTNPAQFEGSEAERRVLDAGMRVAREGERAPL
jgi:pyrroloquinoline quinone biosynthesis protein B